jgi:uncharacterized protein YndB with AHSA1/START domain
MSASDGQWLHLTRVLPAPRAEVWGAITDSAKLAEWWGPQGFTIPSVEFEARAGASYRIAMQPPDGDLFHLRGEFKEVEPPARLAFTFVWEPAAPDDRETLATLSLTEHDDQTEVRLTQGVFATEERRALHEGGWTDSFERLEKLLG